MSDPTGTSEVSTAIAAAAQAVVASTFATLSSSHNERTLTDLIQVSLIKELRRNPTILNGSLTR